MASDPGNETFVTPAPETPDLGALGSPEEVAALRALFAGVLEEPAWVAELRGKVSSVLSNQATILQELQGLRAYVEKIEAEAHESMAKFSSPEAMMEMAGKFLGGA